MIWRTLFVAVVLILVAAGFAKWRLPDTFDPARTDRLPTHAFVLGHVWRLEIANTDASRALGLGERERLPIDTGMLFLFSVPHQYGFWMKGMRFPIDMIFLSRGMVVFIERNIDPSDHRIITPPVPVDQVLELSAGGAAVLSSGDRVWYWRAF